MRELLDPPPEPSKEAWPQAGQKGEPVTKHRPPERTVLPFPSHPGPSIEKDSTHQHMGYRKGEEHTKSKHTWRLPPYIRPRPLAAPVLTPSRKGHRVRRTGNWRPGHLFVRFLVSGILPKTFSGPSQRRLGVCAVVTSYPEMCDS